MRTKTFAIVSTLATLLLGAAAKDAHACGGCFGPTGQNTVVAGHRMALAISPTQTVLWDQIQYSGSPTEFAWVLPVKPGALIEESHDEWFDTLDAATSTIVAEPQLDCILQGNYDGGGFACGRGVSEVDEMASGEGTSGSGGGQSVVVVHQGSVGPYETVTLHSTDDGALVAWLDQHGYGIDPSIQPTLDAYVAEGFDFIALRLMPGADVSQMTPVRVVTQGASYALPLRMVAAGAGAKVPLVLFVIGEGRWSTQDLPEAKLDLKRLRYDFKTAESNYASLRLEALAAGDGRSWLTTFASPSGLFGTGDAGINLDDGQMLATIGEAYFAQSDSLCNARLDLGQSSQLVVPPCDGASDCSQGPNAIDARLFACGDFDDVAVALTGMHPKDVWLTRMEANMPREALHDDLVLRASKTQEAVSRVLQPAAVDNPYCVSLPPKQAPAASIAPGRRGRPGSRDAAILSFFALVAFGLGARRLGTFGKRARRPD